MLQLNIHQIHIAGEKGKERKWQGQVHQLIQA